MTNNNHYDVIIIGTGAGGGTLAYKLAPSGKKILLLERGDYVPREKDNWSTRAVNLEGRYNTKEAWRDVDGKELHPHTNYFVGGNTKFYGAALFRLRKEDFGEIRHHGGISPAWPISYDELEPYYAEAERLYLVHGLAGEDPAEPWRSGPFPHPPVSHEPRIQQLHDDLLATGHNPFHLPVGVDLVVVSCGATNSAALLLKSASDQHPNGLANASGVVGRHYMAHINSAVIAVSKDPNSTKFQKTLGVNDYYERGDDWEFPLGHIQMLAKSDKTILRAGAPWFAPTLALDYMARHSVDFWLTSEDLPSPDNRVTVGRDGQIRLSYTDTNQEGHKRLNRTLTSLLGSLGCHEHLIPHELVRGQRIPIAGVAHQCGTVRFGTDPAQSALDTDCRAHDVDNLYVVDTSFFPSSGAVNPALTAMANALRVGDHLIERLGARRAGAELQEVAS